MVSFSNATAPTQSRSSILRRFRWRSSTRSALALHRPSFFMRCSRVKIDADDAPPCFARVALDVCRPSGARRTEPSVRDLWLQPAGISSGLPPSLLQILPPPPRKVEHRHSLSSMFVRKINRAGLLIIFGSGAQSSRFSYTCSRGLVVILPWVPGWLPILSYPNFS